jgi:hypothetical protein
MFQWLPRDHPHPLLLRRTMTPHVEWRMVCLPKKHFMIPSLLSANRSGNVQPPCTMLRNSTAAAQRSFQCDPHPVCS